MSSLAGRRPKYWHPTPPPPPSPIRLRMPCQHRRRQSPGKVPVVLPNRRGRGTREKDVPEEREREEEERERFQADVLRAECSLLRREREAAVKQMKKNKLNMERTLHSALHILGKKKYHEEYNRNTELKEEMESLEEKLEEMLRKNVVSSDSETPKQNNFDTKAFILQKRLEKLSGESKDKRVRENREMAQAAFALKSIQKPEDRSLVSEQNSNNKFFDVEVLRRKMEGISKGVYKRMEEEYGAMLVSTSHTPSTSKRFEFPDNGSSSLSTRPPHHQEQCAKKCSGNCKIIVRKIMEQVKEESKQWSEMQEMLGQVNKEMDQLKLSRDFWQNRALSSEHQIQSLHSTAQEWKIKAVTIRSKAKQLKREVYALNKELSNYREDQKGKKKKNKDGPKIISLGAHIAKEQRELVYRLKEKENYRSASREFEQGNLNNDERKKSQVFDHGLVGLRRLPFQDIGNSTSPKAKHAHHDKRNLPL